MSDNSVIDMPITDSQSDEDSVPPDVSSADHAPAVVRIYSSVKFINSLKKDRQILPKTLEMVKSRVQCRFVTFLSH